ncbi:hypothetical protein, partial [Streptomyces sp. NPDC048845]|uniref:hypothetical protein n=1 Tax=Streptomyces sp. NPDC048845 TaxID=3155390 RepID=UPI003417D957
GREPAPGLADGSAELRRVAFASAVSDAPLGLYGGFKKSGYGKDLSAYGFEDYTRVKHVMTSLDG